MAYFSPQCLQYYHNWAYRISFFAANFTKIIQRRAIFRVPRISAAL